MSTITQITDAKWFTQIKNGDDFLLAPADFSRNVIGSIFEKVKLVANIKTFTTVEVSDFWFTNTSITDNSATFTNDISVGDVVRLVFAGRPTDDFTFEVTSVTDTIIYFTIITDDGETFDRAVGGDNLLILESDLSFLKYDFGLKSSLSTDEFYRSYLDQETLSFVTEEIGIRSPTPSDPRSVAFVDGKKLSINGHSGSFRVRYSQNSQIPLENAGLWNSAQDYEFEHIFKIQDYSEDDIQNYIDKIKPSNYLGEATLDYNSKFEFRTTETNPSTAKIDTYLSTGSIGFFNENLNGGQNKFSISNLSLTRVSTGLDVDNLAASEPTKITFTINSIENSFNIDPIVVFNHFGEVTDYIQKNVDFDTLFKNDLVRVEGVSSELGTYITEAKILAYTPDSIDLEFTVNPNDSTLDGVDYTLSVLVGDPDRTNISPDKVHVIIQTGIYSDDFDIEGLIGSPDLELFTRDCDPNVDSGFTSMKLISGELINTKFSLPIVDGTISNIEIQTITSKSGVNQVVDSRIIDISGFQTVDGVQRINETLPTPYNLGIDGYIKWISGTNYEILYPYRLPFDKLNSVSGLSDDLFDPTEPNDGQNECVFYQQGKGYSVHIAYLVTMLKDGKSTDYLFKTPSLIINDFENTL